MATLTTLVSFNDATGGNPFAGVMADSQGDLFGTTSVLGPDGYSNYGTVYEVAKTGTSYTSTPTILGVFNGDNGAYPACNLVADASGDLFGTTYQSKLPDGTIEGGGTVFEIPKTAGGYGNLTTLASFGGSIFGGLIIDGTGDLFGTTSSDGTVFEIVKTSTGYGTPTTLASGLSFPMDGLMADASGNLIGTSNFTVFEIVKTATGYANTPVTIASFSNLSAVRGPLVSDSAGDLFGTAFSPGGASPSIVFEIAKTSTGYASTPTTLADPGGPPYSGVIIDAAGNLFGTTAIGGPGVLGTVYEIAKTSTGYASAPTTLVNFDGANGSEPQGALIADAAGNLFGTTNSNSGTGAAVRGTVFEVTNSGFQVTPLPPPVTLGNGNHIVKISGSGNIVTIGNGNSNVSGGQDDNSIVIGNGNSTVSLSGSGNSVTLGNGNGNVTFGGSDNALKVGNGIDTVHGGTGDTIDLATTTLNLYGTDEIVFIGTSNATVNDFSTGLDLKIGPTAGKDVLTNFASDPSGVVDLIGGIGGFATTTAVNSSLKSDGHGGTILSFGSSGSLDFTGLAPSQLHASNFQIG